jgi:DNA replication protein DnaC
MRALKTFTPDAFVPSRVTHEAFIAAKTFNPVRENLYLHGPCGVGKSHLAAIAARPFLPNILTIQPLELLAATVGPGRGDDRAAITRFSKIKVLVLDDAGTGTDSSKTVDRLYDVLNRRYQDAAGGLIVTSNLSLEDLAKYLKDDRIPSRLAQMCAARTFDLSGEPDHRIEKRA